MTASNAITQEMLAKAHAETEAAMVRLARLRTSTALVLRDWLVDVPEYDDNGVLIERFEVTEAQAHLDQMRTAFNPQRPDHALHAGIYTRLQMDGEIWMTDAPAEIRDLHAVDHAMARYEGTSMLIAGLGLGVVLNRAILKREMAYIDVVESDERIIDAVGPYFHDLADAHGCVLNIHHDSIHNWRPKRGSEWEIGWFDIWLDIDADDMPEVARLRKRFRTRLAWFGAWAQDDRISQKRRLASGKWAY